MEMSLGCVTSFSSSSKCCWRYWTMVLLLFDTGSSMWTPQPESYAGTSIGPTDDDVWDMKGHDRHNEQYCPLLTTGVYPYLVKIFADTPDAHVSVRTGVILSHRAVLTVCQGFRQINMKEFRLYAQRVFKRKGLHSDYCYQERRIEKWYKHPKCLDEDSSFQTADKFWDFRVIVVDEMFYAEKDFAYPVVPIHKQPYDLMQFIRKVSVLHLDVEGCELPYFQHPEFRWPVLAYTAKVDSEMHDEACPKAICDPHFTDPEICKNILRGYLNQSFVCVQPKYLTKINLEVVPSWLGSPLVCNNSAIGISTANIVRVDSTKDWFLIATFLRAWPWIMSMKQQFWDKFYNRDGFWDSPFLEHHLWRWHQFTTPRRDKNIEKDPGGRFRFVKPHIIYPDSKKKKSSSVRLRGVTSNIFYAYLVLMPIVLM